MSEEKILVCPECKSERVCTEYHQKIFVNTWEHYCHSMKAHDDDSPATCLDCDWKGIRINLSQIDDPKAKKKEAKERAQYEKLKAKFEVNHD